MKQFLESEIPDLPAKECRFHIIPAPLEATVSYGGGTNLGPAAIIAASYYLEAFDGVSCPCEQGIFTHPAASSLEEIEASVGEVLQQGGFPLMLGGEHTVTFGALRALKAAGQEFGVVQFDAHADLRDEYEGSQLSHACVMRRAIDDLDLPLFQIGVRSLSRQEYQLRQERNIRYLDAVEIARNGIPERLLPADFPDKVYLSFDVDGFDSAIMPATGTPEPGGLDWREVSFCLEKIVAERQLIGADFVELAPIENFPAPDFTVARLIYNLLGLVERS